MDSGNEHVAFLRLEDQEKDGNGFPIMSQSMNMHDAPGQTMCMAVAGSLILKLFQRDAFLHKALFCASDMIHGKIESDNETRGQVKSAFDRVLGYSLLEYTHQCFLLRAGPKGSRIFYLASSKKDHTEEDKETSFVTAIAYHYKHTMNLLNCTNMFPVMLPLLKGENMVALSPDGLEGMVDEAERLFLELGKFLSTWCTSVWPDVCDAMGELPYYAVFLMNSGQDPACRKTAKIVQHAVDSLTREKEDKRSKIKRTIDHLKLVIDHQREKLDSKKKSDKDYDDVYNECDKFKKKLEEYKYDLEKTYTPNFYPEWEILVEKLRALLMLEFSDADIDHAQKSISFIVAVFYLASKRMLAASLSVHLVRKIFPEQIKALDGQRFSVTDLFSPDLVIVTADNFYTILLGLSNETPLGTSPGNADMYMKGKIPDYARIWLERDFFSASRLNSTEIHQFDVDPRQCATYENKYFYWNVMCPPSEILALPYYSHTIMKKLPSLCESRTEYPDGFADGVFEFKGCLGCNEFLGIFAPTNKGKPTGFAEPACVSLMLRDLVHSLGYPISAAQVTVTRGLMVLSTVISTILPLVERKELVQLGKFILGRVIPDMRKGTPVERLRRAWEERKEVSFTRIDVGANRSADAHRTSYTFCIVYIPAFKPISKDNRPKIKTCKDAKRFIDEHAQPGMFYVVDSHSVLNDNGTMSGVISSFALTDPLSMQRVNAEIERYISQMSSESMAYVNDLCQEFFSGVISSTPGITELADIESPDFEKKYPVAAKMHSALMESHVLHIHDMDVMAFVPSPFASSSVARINFKKSSHVKKTMKLVSRSRENIDLVSKDKNLLNEIASSVIVPSFIAASAYFCSIQTPR